MHTNINGLFPVLDAVLALYAVYLVFQLVPKLRQVNRSQRLPPGPRPLSLIGNLLDLPNSLEGPHWAKHKSLYGPISSVSMFGTTIVILNDAQIAYDLLEKRSLIYSSRPVSTFGGEMVGFSLVTSLLPYGDLFKAHRKQMHAYIGTRAAISRFEPLEERETSRFLLRVLKTPSKLVDHIRTTPGAIILSISHGYTIEPFGPDPFVDLANEALEYFSASCQPGTWNVDVLPILRYLPEWLPGMGFKRTAREWRAVVMDFINKPYGFVKHQMAAGRAGPSYTSENIEKGISDEAEEEALKWAASTLYGGGADTTVSAVSSFFLAMTLYPDAFARARAELDHIVGTDRLPTLADRARLPYVEATFKEVLRWQNVVPMGLPHVTTEEDVYMNYYIPKGAIVLANIWQMAHDPSVYHDPMTFNPERFLGTGGRPAEPDSRRLSFGFGRRICPGKELADGSLFITVAMTISVFDISLPKDAAERKVAPVIDCTPGIISHPKPFTCSVVPRSEKAESLIRAVQDEHPFEESDANVLRSLWT